MLYGKSCCYKAIPQPSPDEMAADLEVLDDFKI